MTVRKTGFIVAAERIRAVYRGCLDRQCEPPLHRVSSGGIAVFGGEL
jgi:hypothetical protein